MSVITREPVMLDSTGQQIANAINSLEQSLDVKRVQKSASDAVEAANKASKAATDASNQINTALSAVQSAASLMDFKKEFTVPGNPVVGKFAPGKPLGIQMSLLSQQGGSGTPSPSNVRPIVAQTGKVSVCGKNLAIPLNTGGKATHFGNRDRGQQPFPAGTYTFTAFNGTDVAIKVISLVSGNTIFSGVNKLTFTADSPFRIYISHPNNAFATLKFQLELGNASTEYEEPNITTYTPALPSDFAGGTVKLSKPGDLSGCDKKLVLTGDENWEAFVTGGRYRMLVRNVDIVPPASDSTRPTNIISTHAPIASIDAISDNIQAIAVSSMKTLHIQMMPNTNSVDVWKSYLKAQYAAGTPFTIFWQSTSYDKSKDLPVSTVTQTHKSLALTGDEAWATAESPYRFGKAKLMENVKSNVSVICSHFLGGLTVAGKTNTVAVYDSGYVDIVHPDNPTLDNYKAWLKAQATVGTPVTLVGELKTPITLALPESDKTTVCGIEDMNTIIGDCQTMTVTGERHIAFEESPTTKLEKFIENYYNMRRTPEIYQTKIWKFASNPTSACEKLMANADLNYTPATDTDKGVDDYENIPLFQWVHCNYVRDKYGVPHPTAIEGMPEYRTDGSVDVGVMQMSFYVKWDDSNKDYTLLSISGMPFDGAKPWCECVGSNDKILPYCIGSAYYSGIAHDGKLRSQPNLNPENFMSHDKMLTEYQKKGEGYWGAGGCRNTFGIIFSLIKGANKSSQNLYQGCTNYNLQYDAAEKSATALDYFPVTEDQAANFVLGSCVSVGYGAVASGAVSKDRGYGNVHKYADKAKITKIAKVKDGVWGIYLSSGKIQSTADVKLNDTLTSTVFISTMPWRSGSTDAVMGHRDGSAASNSNAKTPFRVQGREYMIGAYTVSGDTVVDCISDGTRVYYVADRWTKHSNTDATIRSTYKKAVTVPNINAAADFLLGDIGIDPVSGASYPAANGSSASTGVGDYFYWGGSGTGTREQLCCGSLRSGSSAGFSCVVLRRGRSYADWDVVAAD